MTTNNENNTLWNKVCETEKAMLKKVSYGRGFLSIDAYSQFKIATGLWGSYGKKWGVKDEKYTPIGNTVILYTATFFYPEGSVPIHSNVRLVSSTKNTYNEDWSKTVATDALTKGLSMLGFSADVFMGLHDGKNKELVSAKIADEIDEKAGEEMKQEELEKLRKQGVVKALAIFNQLPIKSDKAKEWIANVQLYDIKELLRGCKKFKAGLKSQEKGVNNG